MDSAGLVHFGDGATTKRLSQNGIVTTVGTVDSGNVAGLALEGTTLWARTSGGTLYQVETTTSQGSGWAGGLGTVSSSLGTAGLVVTRDAVYTLEGRAVVRVGLPGHQGQGARGRGGLLLGVRGGRRDQRPVQLPVRAGLHRVAALRRRQCQQQVAPDLLTEGAAPDGGVRG